MAQFVLRITFFQVDKRMLGKIEVILKSFDQGKPGQSFCLNSIWLDNLHLNSFRRLEINKILYDNSVNDCTKYSNLL